MSETAFISTIVIVQFTILAGLVLYMAQRIERRIDRLEVRIDRLEERLRAVELGQAKLVGRQFGDDRSEFDLQPAGAEPAIEQAAPAAT